MTNLPDQFLLPKGRGRSFNERLETAFGFSTMRTPSHRSSRLCALWGLIVSAWVAGAGFAQAQALSVLHSFGAGASTPHSSLVQDGSGNSFGTTSSGGSAGHGTIYKVAPDGTTTILHSFGAAPVTLGGDSFPDGTVPTGNLILANDGNLYGTTADGGASFGAVYRISTSGVYSFIYVFAAQNSIASPAREQSAGVFPESGVIQGLDGNLYGTASQGGDNGTGVVFQLSLDGRTYTVLHSFGAIDPGTAVATQDAAYPYLGLVQDAQGNFYGATARGGSADTGAIYEITNSRQYTVLTNFPAPASTFSFNQSSAYILKCPGNFSPNSALVAGPDGNLYGTASSCNFGGGAIYKVTPQGVLTILHQFGDGTVPGDGGEPKFLTGTAAAFALPPRVNALILGADQKLYGTTALGGAANSGVIYQITTGGQYAIVHNFGDGSVANDGAQPVGLVQGTDGNFYGTTALGGDNTSGTVFKIVSALPEFTSPLHVWAALGAPFTYHITATQGPDTFAVGSLLAGSTLSGTSSISLGNTLPAGFSFDGVNTVSATPTTAGTFSMTLVASNSAGWTAAPLQVTVMATPVISSLLQAEGTTTGVPYQILATGSPTSFAATGLPPGVTVNYFNGEFIGTPTTPGTYHVTVSATNAAGTGSAVLTLTILSAAPTSSQQYTQIRSFNDGSVSGEGTFPGAMTKGTDGALYGVTAQGGVGGGGTVFSLLPSGVTRVVASFNGTNGSAPQGVMQTTDGTLYGTTATGGTAGLGVIFKITPDGTLTVIHNFGDGSVINDGANPQAGLILASDGNFYGTTQNGGSASSGTVFKMTPAGVVTILHSFGDGSVAHDGAQPVAPLTALTGITIFINNSGTVYPFIGTTLRGGAQDAGTIFGITSTGQVTIFHSFGDPTVANDGQLPHGALLYVPPGSGTLSSSTPLIYGTTTTGGAQHEGTLFACALGGTGMTILHSFGDGTVPHDGANPLSSLVLIPPSAVGGLVDSGGVSTAPVLCGTTQNGGAYASGTVFTCTFSTLTGTPTSSTTTILHNFSDPTVTNDGTTPLGGGVVLGPDNNVYGTTMSGGNSYGTAFAIQTNQSTYSNLIFTPLGWNYMGTLPAGMGFDSTTGTLTGMPSSSAALGTYSITIYNTASGGGQGNASSPQTINLQLSQTFASWASVHAVSSRVTSGSSGGPADGVPMALKYLFDVRNPSQPMSVADHAAMPAVGVDESSVPGTPYVALTYRQNAGMTGMTVSLESSDDMVNWSPVTGNALLQKQSGTDAATGDPMMEMGAPMDGSRHQFLRLKVTLQ